VLVWEYRSPGDEHTEGDNRKDNEHHEHRAHPACTRACAASAGEEAAARTAAAQARYARARRWAGKPSLIGAIILVLLARCAKQVNSGADTGRTLLTVLIVCAPGLAWTAPRWYRRDQAANAQPDQDYRQALQAWQ
jgi:hypothetical protein